MQTRSIHCTGEDTVEQPARFETLQVHASSAAKGNPEADRGTLQMMDPNHAMSHHSLFRL